MKIVQAQVAIIFALDNDIVLTVGSCLKNIQQRYKGHIQILNNIPELSPPNAPRMVFSAPGFIINVSLLRFDIMINPPQHISSDAGKVFDYIQSLVLTINELLIEKNVKYEWAGFVLTIEIPMNGKTKQSSLEYFGPIFDKLINIKRNEKKLASFSLQYGFVETDFFLNYSINGYEKLNINFPNIIQNPQSLSSITPEIIESGIVITLDINNKPQQSKKTFKDDFISTLSQSMSYYKTILEDTRLKEFI
jgi:hypothetical protein